MTGIDPYGKDFKGNINPLVLFPPALQEAEEPKPADKDSRDDDDDANKDDEEDCSGPGDYDVEKTDDGKEMVVYDKEKGAIKLSSSHWFIYSMDIPYRFVNVSSSE